MAAFRYAHLESAKSIRLVVLRPSLFQSVPVSCYLRNVDLMKPPKYEALSYTWDDQKPSIPVQCGTSQLLITDNVDAALRHLRRRFFFRRTLWIDAICIDQHSVKERGSQVALMDDIFRNASRVLVWLGTGDKITSRAIQVLKLVFPLWRFLLHLPFSRYAAIRRFQRLKAELQDVLAEDHIAASLGKSLLAATASRDSASGLRRIVNHNWFRRIWTIQEVSLARKTRIVFGNSTISWKSLSSTLSFDSVLFLPSVSPPVLREGGYNPATPIFNGSPFMHRVQQIQIFRESLRATIPGHSWSLWQSQVQRLPSMAFIFNLLLTGLNPDYHATNSRDRVFGLQGLLSAYGVKLPTPDYSMPLSNILAESIKSVAAKQNSLEFLEFVTGETLFQELPSWIPDFNAVPWCTPTVDLPDSCSDFIKTPKVKLGETELIVSGTIVGRIKSHPSSFALEDAAEKHPYTALNMTSESFLDGLRNWIRFVQEASTNTNQETKALLLFQLLLHPQIVPFYESVGFQVYDHLAVQPGDLFSEHRLSEHRLFQHFSAWLDAVQSRNPILTSSSDHVLDQVQHFISCEWINTTVDVNNKEHTIGYRRAMLVIQRWVREFVARKRLFSTDAGLVGIAWRAAGKGDLVVKVDGVRSLMVLREVHGGERYQVVGPCNIPLFRGGFTLAVDGGQRRFLLV